MTPSPSLGFRIRQAREARGWNRDQLAEKANALREVACPDAEPLTAWMIRDVETRRMLLKLNDPRDPMPYVLRAVGLGLRELGEAVGL